MPSVETVIPGRSAIELIAFYEEFRSYYPLCELETKRWFVENVQKDWWIFDVGANIGYYSILFAQLAPLGRVMSFEPTSTAAMLRANLAHNSISNIEVHEVALGAVSGIQNDRIFRLWGGEGDVKNYQFYKLDDFVAKQNPARIDCLKIDVDSFDFEVLQGAEKTLEAHNPVIVVELNHALAKRNQSAGQALAWLATRGYREALVLDDDNFVLQRDRKFNEGKTHLSLLFPEPLRFTESLDTFPGSDIASPFTVAELQNGSTIDGLAPPTVAGSNEHSSNRLFDLGLRLLGQKKPGYQLDKHLLSSLVGRKIQTSSRKWSYGLVVFPDAGAWRANVTDQTVLSFEIEVEVFQGKLGIAIGGDDPSGFVSPERILTAMDGIQRILIKAQTAQIQSLIFRTTAAEGTFTVFSILGIKARAKQ